MSAAGIGKTARVVNRSAVVAVLVLVSSVLVGCSSSDKPDQPAAAPASPTYNLEPRTARPDERVLTLPVARDGDTAFQLIGLTTGLPTLVGSHAEFAARGEFDRIRLVVSNVGRSSVLFNARRQQIVLADGTTKVPDGPAMLVKRQLDSFDLGAGVRVEFDLYYDVPKGSQAVALMAYGGPTLTDMKDAEGTKIALS